jgi:hypothetical protein
MSIATSPRPRISLRQERNPASERLPMLGESDCAPTERRSKESQAINISPVWGEAINSVPLHF